MPRPPDRNTPPVDPIMPRSRRLAALLLLAPLTGCGDSVPERAPAHPVTSDSAGVRIVDNGAVDPWAAGFAPDSAPLFRVGWSEHPDSIQFAFVQQGAILDSGNFAVADLARVVVLRPDGSIAYSVGGAGKGPGEFGFIWRLVAGRGDTLIAHELETSRVATFAGPELVSDMRLPEDDRIHRNDVQGIHGGALILPATGSHFVDGPPSEWYDAPVLRIADGVVDTVVSLSFARKGRNQVLTPIGWARVSGDRLVHARGDEHVVRWYTLDGDLAQVSRWTSPRMEATDSFWTRYAEARRGSRRFSEMSAGEFREVVESWRSTAVGPLPTYSELYGDPLGGAWLGEWDADPGPPARYRYLDRDGILRGALALPEGFDALAFGDGVVLGVERNEFDVAAAVAYRFFPVR